MKIAPNAPQAAPISGGVTHKEVLRRISVTLSWPTYGGTYIPQSTTTLLPAGTVWTDVSGTPTVGTYNATLGVTATAQPTYFRLRRAP